MHANLIKWFWVESTLQTFSFLKIVVGDGRGRGTPMQVFRCASLPIEKWWSKLIHNFSPNCSVEFKIGRMHQNGMHILGPPQCIELCIEVKEMEKKIWNRPNQWPWSNKISGNCTDNTSMHPQQRQRHLPGIDRIYNKTDGLPETAFQGLACGYSHLPSGSSNRKRRRLYPQANQQHNSHNHKGGRATAVLLKSALFSRGRYTFKQTNIWKERWDKLGACLSINETCHGYLTL